MKKILLSLFALGLFFAPNFANAAESYSVVGVQGYDLVSYQTDKKPLPGNGNHLVMHNGVNYLFVSEANKKKFQKNPAKYLPAYGGYCAFGVSVGKKFIGDPTVWKIVDGQLYLNLDNGIKEMWVKDIPGNLVKADKNWLEIKDKKASEL